jgi:hypothetical protein
MTRTTDHDDSSHHKVAGWATLDDLSRSLTPGLSHRWSIPLESHLSVRHASSATWFHISGRSLEHFARLISCDGTPRDSGSCNGAQPGQAISNGIGFAAREIH